MRSATQVSKWRFRVYGAAVLLLASAGCSTSPIDIDSEPHEKGGGTSAAGWEEPGWMTEQRREREEGGQAWLECVRDLGWSVTLKPDGMLSAKGEIAEEQRLLMNEDIAGCAEQAFGEYQELSESEWRVMYQKALDTRECLISQGYDVPEPPSEDSWVQAGIKSLGDQWAPFDYIVNGLLNGTIDLNRTEYYELYNACPQATPTVNYSF